MLIISPYIIDAKASTNDSNWYKNWRSEVWGV